MSKELTHKEFCSKLVDNFMRLINKGDLDKIIYGNAYWEFTDRKIELIDPNKVTLTNSKTKKCNVDKYYIQTNRLTNSKLNGIDIIEPKNKKRGKK